MKRLGSTRAAALLGITGGAAVLAAILRWVQLSNDIKSNGAVLPGRYLYLVIAVLSVAVLAALAVPAFAQEAEKQPTLQPASEHPSVLLNTPAVEIPAVRAEIEPMCVPHASMRSLSIARGYEGYLYYSLYRGTYSGTYGYSI